MQHVNTFLSQMPACKFIATGNCTKGSACPFSHTAEARHRSGVSTDMATEAAICMHFQRGKCLFGDSCKRRHVPATPLQKQDIVRSKHSPNPSASSFVPRHQFAPSVSTEKNPGVSNSRTINPTTCLFYQQNRCFKGSSCTFSHQESILTRISQATEAVAVVPLVIDPLRSRDPCIYFASGRCRNGDACAFRHEKKQLVSDLSSSPFGKPCQYFSRGNCNNGVQCAYLHSSPQSSTPVAHVAKDRPSLERLGLASSQNQDKTVKDPVIGKDVSLQQVLWSKRITFVMADIISSRSIISFTNVKLYLDPVLQ